MAYSAQTDIETRISASVIISLTDDEKLATTATTVTAAIVLNSDITARITAAIADADAEIDSYIRKQYTVPLSSTPQQIKRISVDLATYFLHTRRRSEMGIPEDVFAIRRDAIAYLKGVNTGHVDLGISPPPAASAAVVAETDSEDQAFTVDTLKNF